MAEDASHFANLALFVKLHSSELMEQTMLQVNSSRILQRPPEYDKPPKIRRRDALAALVAGLAIGTQARVLSGAGPRRSGMGLVTYCCQFQRQRLRAENAGFDLFSPLNFLKHCQSLGAGGMQCGLGILPREEIKFLQATADKYQLYVEAIVKLPDNDADLDRFDKEMSTAKECRALAARTTIIGGRRYENYKSLTQFKEVEQRGVDMLLRGVKIAEKYKLPIAVENHKDQRNSDRIALFKKISSEYVGACLDTGNSIALLEDPLQTIKDFAPWAHSVHLKDQSLAPHEDGFLLGDVPLGQGSLNLQQMVELIRKAKPHIRFSLELITRDPLLVPCLSPDYWSTFPDLPAYQLAATLRLVLEDRSENGQQISAMTADEQLAREDQNIRESLEYAARELGI